MKKLLIVVLAAAAMVACTNDEVVSVKGGDAIAFDNAFIDNATRAAADPSTTTANIDGFNVWAFMDQPEGTVFVGEEVTKVGGDWAYTNTQYWLPNHDYYFAAISPIGGNWALTPEADVADAVKGAGIVEFTNADGSEDLIYAVKHVATPTDINTQPGAVKFQFKHLLSKVKFTFENGFGTDNATVKVTNINMVAPGYATIDLAQDDYSQAWDIDAAQDVTLYFGDLATTLESGAKDECAQERLTIPAAATEEYKVTFTATLYMGSVEALTANLESTVTGVELEMGKAYNFKATLNSANISADGNNLYPIEFEVEAVEDWVNGGEPEFDVDTNDPIVVEDGETFDGQGSTISAGEGRADSANGIITPASGDVTIKNVNIDGNNRTTEGGKGLRGIYLNGVEGNYIIENVTIQNTAYAINVNTTKNVNLYVYNSLLQGWTSYGDSTTGYFENVNFTVGSYYTPGNSYSSNDNGLLRPYGNTTLVNCNFQDGFYICLSEMAGNTLILNNCTYGGVAITADNYKTLVNWDNYTDACDIVIQPTAVSTADEFATALKANYETIHVVLQNDIDVAINTLGTQTAGSGEYKLGGADTQEIIIDLNGKKLNVTTTYWSAFGANNADAVITIKNGEMISTGNSAGTWNAWDLRFSNCDYVFEDVKFLKAVALDNVGKSTLMKNVTITDTHNTDTYALWITAEGQDVTLDGCYIDMYDCSDGRGIKIDNQYVDTPAMVTLNVANTTFKTEEKAAIIVKNPAGAEINIDNITISGVVADTTNAVWVDSDAAAYADLVVVNGASKIVEP